MEFERERERGREKASLSIRPLRNDQGSIRKDQTSESQREVFLGFNSVSHNHL